MPFIALVKKEIYRFSSIWVQTIVGPMTTALLYQLIFGSQLATTNIAFSSINYATFLIPGLIMMQILLNAFGNSSSTLIQAKYTGNLIFVLMAPISPTNMYLAYLLASIIRGLAVGIAVFGAICWFGTCKFYSLWAIVYFAVLGSAITSGLGMIAGICLEKFDQLAGFQSFVMVPLIYLSGVFFTAHNISPIWQQLARLDPFLYIVDGFRYGFIGQVHFNLWYGSSLVLVCAVIINGIGISLIGRGIKIKL